MGVKRWRSYSGGGGDGVFLRYHSYFLLANQFWFDFCPSLQLFSRLM